MYVLCYLILVLFLFLSKASAQICSPATCSTSTVPVRFPFSVESRQPKRCGYPGFNLSCSSLGRAVVKLPNSGDFLAIRDIDYLSQKIKLYDPKDCLPRRLLELNLSGSPFFAAYYVNYTFLECPMNLTSEFTVPCLSNNTNRVIATSNTAYAKSISAICNFTATLAVPTNWPGQYQESSADLFSDLHLWWSSPDCFRCEAKGGLCGYESNTSEEIGCFRDPDSNTGHSNRGLPAFGIICLSIALPPIIFSIILWCCAWCFDWIYGLRRPNNSRLYDLRRPNNSRQGRNLATVRPQPTQQSTMVTIGLAESTIASFTKVVLGESRRLPGQNDNTCPICLSEYQPKEIVRCIPECKHCFHADCIDEWLKMNITCPVCRNCPSPVQDDESTTQP